MVTNMDSNNATVDQLEIKFTVLETSLAAAALILILTLTVVGNSTICFVVFKNRRMRTAMNLFLVNLAFGDMAVGLLSMVFPLATAIKRKWIFNDTVCQINAVCNQVLFCSTMFTHTVISIDRYFAIVRPLKKFMTAKKAFLMVLGVWVISIVLVLGPVFGWGHMEFNPSTLQCGYGFPRTKFESLYILLLALIAFVIPLITMTVLYSKVFHSLRGHTRRMSMTVSGQHQAALKAQIRIGATFFLALVVFFICWAPFLVFITYAVVVKDRASIPHGLGLAAYWCGFVNSLCNPFIVGIRSKQFNKAFAKIFCCYCCRPRRRPRSYRTDKNGLRRSKNSNRSRSTTDSDTRITETSIVKSNSTRSSYAVDARQIREELDRDAAERDPLPEYDPGNIVFEPSPKRKRKSGVHVTDVPPDTNIPYKQFVHVVRGSSFHESGV